MLLYDKDLMKGNEINEIQREIQKWVETPGYFYSSKTLYHHILPKLLHKFIWMHHIIIIKIF